MLFVGINPSLRSAQTGHHFAGHSNRSWKLLHESKLVGEPLTYREGISAYLRSRKSALFDLS
jgi:TDG/mug DNA glycosylase family protein